MLSSDPSETFNPVLNTTDSLDKGTLEVRKVLGEDVTLSDAAIKDALWHYYFDVPKSVTWLLGRCFFFKKSETSLYSSESR